MSISEGHSQRKRAIHKGEGSQKMEARGQKLEERKCDA